MDDISARSFLRSLFDSAVASANPFKVLAAHLPEKPRGRCVVVGAGKASAAMAAALEQAWPDVHFNGVVVTRYGHAMPTSKIRIIEAAHPVPDDNSLLAGKEILQAVSGLREDDLVIALISGGGSALLVAPAEGISLSDKQSVNRALLKSGAGIDEINTVRKHLSLIKGGKLAMAARPAKVVTLVISDVPGDNAAIIASGPTVRDQSNPGDARDILARYGITMSTAVSQALNQSHTQITFPAEDVRKIASPVAALKAASTFAISQGVIPLILGDALEGEARELGRVMAGIAVSSQLHGQPVKPPCVLLSGGEATVSIQGTTPGRGGRNTEFLLSLAIALQGQTQIWAIAGDTDGIDGTEDAAGAIISPDTLSRARMKALKPRDALAAHDSYSFFQFLDDLIMTGPTLTNVNDFRAILILPA
jgi:glycerate 2-kinase